MFKDITIENFRSFKNETTFSMETGARVRQYPDSVLIAKNNKYLKSSVLFGGNANGKTNVLLAIMALRNLIITPTAAVTDLLPVDTFAYNSANTKFNINFIKQGKDFSYAVEYNAEAVINERLIVDEATLFARDNQNIQVLPAELQMLKGTVRPNQLLLFVLQANNNALAQLAYEWFATDVVFVNTDSIANAKFQKLNDLNFKERFLTFLRAADFNISDVEVLERTEQVPNFSVQVADNEPAKFAQAIETIKHFDVYSTHNTESGQFKVHFYNESTGTKVFMLLAMYVLENSGSDKLLLIDEFDRSFHVELAQALMDVFNHKNQRNQYILTTHELGLMDYNLRQDQIWFAEKNRSGETEIFSIFDFTDADMKRGDASYKRRYLEGRYGAKQVINMSALFEGLGN